MNATERARLENARESLRRIIDYTDHLARNDGSPLDRVCLTVYTLASSGLTGAGVPPHDWEQWRQDLHDLREQGKELCEAQNPTSLASAINEIERILERIEKRETDERNPES